MSLERPPFDPVLATLFERLIEIYLDQPEEGRAAILGFFHTSSGAERVKVRFRTRRSGSVSLFMETLGQAAIEVGEDDEAG